MTETLEQRNARLQRLAADKAAWNARIEAAHRSPEQVGGKPGSAQPFKRAKQMYMELLDLRGRMQGDLLGLQIAINQYPAYQSRGKGKRRRK